MSESFNPYREWLGHEQDASPDDYYSLLGLPRFESDLSTVSQAADRVRARIRSIRPGEHVAAWQKLLDEVSAARACLLNPETKSQYDAALRRPSAPTMAEPPRASSRNTPVAPLLALPPGLEASRPSAAPPRPMAVSLGEPPGPVRPTFQAMPSWEEYTAELSRGPTVPIVAPLQASPATMPAAAPAVVGGYAAMPQSAAAAGGLMPSFGQPTSVPPWSPVTLPFPAPTLPAGPMVVQAVAVEDGMEAFAPAPTLVRTTRRQWSASVLLFRLALILLMGFASVYGIMLVQEQRRRELARTEQDESETIGEESLGNGNSRPKPRDGIPPSAEAPATAPAQSKIEPDQQGAPQALTSPVAAKAKNGKDGKEGSPQIAMAGATAAAPGTGATSGSAASAKPAAATPAPVDAQKQDEYKRSLAAARTAMGERNLTIAKQHLERAGSNVQSPAEQDELNRYQSLMENLKEFWRLMRGRMARLQPLEEFEVGNTRAIVVSADENGVTIRSGARTYTYRPETLPAALLIALADTGLSKDPNTKVIYGCFLATDPAGDLARARRLWAEAQQAGVNVKDMLPGAGSIASAGPAEAPDTRPAPPEAEKVQAATEAIRAKFAVGYRDATSPLKRQELARKLLALGSDAGQDAETRYSALKQAQEVASAAGKAELACTAIDRLAEAFVVDPVTLKTAALEGVAENVRSSTAQKELATVAIKVAEKAANAQRSEEAARIVKVGAEAARKAANMSLVKQFLALQRQLQGGTQ